MRQFQLTFSSVKPNILHCGPIAKIPLGRPHGAVVVTPEAPAVPSEPCCSGPGCFLSKTLSDNVCSDPVKRLPRRPRVAATPDDDATPVALTPDDDDDGGLRQRRCSSDPKRTTAPCCGDSDTFVLEAGVEVAVEADDRVFLAYAAACRGPWQTRCSRLSCKASSFRTICSLGRRIPPFHHRKYFHGIHDAAGGIGVSYFRSPGARIDVRSDPRYAGAR